MGTLYIIQESEQKPTSNNNGVAAALSDDNYTGIARPLLGKGTDLLANYLQVISLQGY